MYKCIIFVIIISTGDNESEEHDMTANQIKAIIENGEFEYYGIRSDDVVEYKVGDTCYASHQWWQDDPECYPAFYLVLNHPTFDQIKKRHGINYSDRFYIRLLYVVTG